MTELLARALESLQRRFPPNRVVVLLTPLAFVPASAFVAAYLARHFPGVPYFGQAEILGAMVVGAGSAITFAYRWLANWERAEQRAHERHAIERTTRLQENVALINAGHHVDAEPLSPPPPAS